VLDRAAAADLEDPGEPHPREHTAGHQVAARATVTGVSERDVQTQIEYAFFANGATGLSYPSIVGSGLNGAVLHWDQNTRILTDGDLVVIDAAAEYGRYAADVTRTYPVSGHFTPEQAEVYLSTANLFDGRIAIGDHVS
jgi:Xaa-Pro aminopeptidase